MTTNISYFLLSCLSFPRPPAFSVMDSKKKKPLLLLHLASSSLQCLYLGLVKNPSLNKYIRDKLSPDHVSSLALLVQNLDAIMSTVGQTSSSLGGTFCSMLSSFSSQLMELLQEMIVSGLISKQYLQVREMAGTGWGRDQERLEGRQN